MVHGKKRIPYWIDRRLTGLAGPEYHAIISFGLPIEPEDSQYGKYWVECPVRFETEQLLIHPRRWGILSDDKPVRGVSVSCSGNAKNAGMRIHPREASSAPSVGLDAKAGRSRPGTGLAESAGAPPPAPAALCVRADVGPPVYVRPENA